MFILTSLSDNASAITELRSLLDIYVSLRSRSISLLGELDAFFTRRVVC